jgi:hypothetical protein
LNNAFIIFIILIFVFFFCFPTSHDLSDFGRIAICQIGEGNM